MPHLHFIIIYHFHTLSPLTFPLNCSIAYYCTLYLLSIHSYSGLLHSPHLGLVFLPCHTTCLPALVLAWPVLPTLFLAMHYLSTTYPCFLMPCLTLLYLVLTLSCPAPLPVIKNKNIAILDVDDVTSSPATGTVGATSTDTNNPLFLGTQPLINRRRGRAVLEKYVGCIRNVSVNKDHIDLAYTTFIGNVNAGACPTI